MSLSIVVVVVDPPGGGVGEGVGAGVLEPLSLSPQAEASSVIRRTFARC